MNYYFWNKLICQKFFNPENKGKRVYLSVTEAEIEEISSENPELNLGGFDGFVTSIIDGPLALREIFWESILKKALQLYRLYNKSNSLGVDEEWKSLDRDRMKYPPFVGYLAFFVLAEFENINSISSIAYYDKVDKLLSKFLSPDQTRDKFSPRSLYPIDHLWTALSSWSINVNNGDLGEFVSHKRMSFRYVFRAKEQALLNYSDRKKLYLVLSKSFTPYFLPNMKQAGLALRDHTNSRYAYLFAADQLLDSNLENRLLRKTIYNIIIHDIKNALIIGQTETIHKILYLVPFISFKELMGGKITYRTNLRKTELKEFFLELRGKSFQISPSSYNSDWSQPVTDEEDLFLTGNDWSTGAVLKVSLSQYKLIFSPKVVCVFSKTIDSRKIPDEPYVEVNRLKVGGTYLIATNNKQKYKVLVETLADNEICDNYEFETVIANKPDGWDFIRLEGLRRNMPQLPELYIEPEDDFTTDDLEIKIELVGGVKIKADQYLNIALPSIQVNDFSPKIIETGGTFSVKAIEKEKEYELFPVSEHSRLSIRGPDYFDDYAEFFIDGLPDEGTSFVIETRILVDDNIDTFSRIFRVAAGRYESLDMPVGRDGFGRVTGDGGLHGYGLGGSLPNNNQEILFNGFPGRSTRIKRENLSLDLCRDDIEEVLNYLDLASDLKGSDVERKIRELRRQVELLKLKLRDENL